MFKFSFRYFILSVLLLLIEIFIGSYLHDAIIRPYGGDFLVVILIYCFVKSFWELPLLPAAIGVLLFAYAVEVSQYFHLVILLGLGHVRAARIILGTSFSVIDLLTYTLGIGLVLLVELLRTSKMKPPQAIRAEFSASNKVCMAALLTSRIRTCILLLIIGLLFSGITAFPIESELAWLIKQTPGNTSLLYQWLARVYEAVKLTNNAYPFLSYGTDWLAFAHLILAILFIGPLKKPVTNKWVIEFGIIAAILIFPLAFIAGAVRGIPYFWRLMDCSFGVAALLLLLPYYHWTMQLNKL